MDFALVHGSYHGGWCWDLVTPELERLGHRVITVDLPISEAGLGAADYAQAVDRAIPPGVEPVLVGHSMGGLVIPLVAAHRPIRRLVFLSAFIPVPGQSANEQRAAEPIDGRFPLTTAEFTDLGDDVWMIGAATATELFFYDASADLGAWATGRLRRQCYRVMSESSPLEAWPDVPSSSIICRDDHALNPDWERAAARDRLDVRPIELAGGHSPFLTRPAELAAVLDSLV